MRYVIVLEGINLSGKSYIANYIKQNLESENFAVYIVSHNHKGKLDSMLYEKDYLTRPVSERLIMSFEDKIDMSREVENIFRKETRPNILVILDRYVDSIYAYEPLFNVFVNDIIKAHSVFKDVLIIPDKTIYIQPTKRIILEHLMNCSEPNYHEQLMKDDHSIIDKLMFNYNKFYDNVLPRIKHFYPINVIKFINYDKHLKIEQVILNYIKSVFGIV